MLCDLSKAEWKGMIRHACKAADIDIAHLALVVASPPCETLSPCDASNVTRGNEHKDHKDPERPPRRLSSCKKPEDFEKRAKAIAHDKMVENLVLSLLHDMENGADYDALIENPVGSLRRRPYMNTAAVQSQFNRTPTDHCAFSEHIRSVPASQQTQKQAQPQKPTDYWHTLLLVP